MYKIPRFSVQATLADRIDFRPCFTALLLVLLNACSNDNGTSFRFESLPTNNAPEGAATISFTAKVGTSGSTIDFLSNTGGYEFYRSREGNCDLGNYASCDAGQYDVLDGDRVVDTALTLDSDAYFVLADGERRSFDTLITNRHFTPRHQHQIVEFNNRLWLIGYGNRKSSRHGSDIWSSNDGIAWREEISDAGIPPRANYRSIVFNEKIWLVGGVRNPLTGTGHLNDIWSSDDGINWIQEGNAEFDGRQGHQLVVFDNRLWMIGGFNGDGAKSDVWSTSNGTDWSLVANESDFPARTDFQTVVFDEQIWIIAGSDGDNNLNDVWSSSDGVNWHQVNAEASFSPRARHQAAVFDGRIWVIAGNSGQSDVWSSDDGLDWVLEQEQIIPFSREDFQLRVFRNNLWVIGGARGGGVTDTNEIWSSSDGVDWIQRTNNLNVSDLSNMVLFKDQLWAIGGGPSHSVWNSADGIEWTLVIESAGFSPNEIAHTWQRHRLAEFQGRLWAIAPESTNTGVSAWSTADGIAWRLETEEIPAQAAGNLHLLVFNNQLWLVFPGTDGLDALASTNGIDWLQLDEKWALPPYMTAARMIVFNDKMWLIGGSILREFGGTYYPEHKAEVWSTSDGSNWVMETEHAEFGPRGGHRVLQYNQKLWIAGSVGPMGFEPEDDYWSSSDGINWDFEFTAPYFSTGHSVHVLNNEFFTIGGSYDRDQNAWFYNVEEGWRKGIRGTIRFPER